MNIELKRIQHIERLSHETACFSADIWVDGVKIGEIGNEGQGGPDSFHGDHVAFARADAWCRANLPHWSLDDRPATFETDLEMHCATILESHIGMKQMKRDFARKIIFSKPGVDGIYSVTVKAPAKPADPKVQAQVLSRHPGAVILNTLPIEEAYRLYCAA